MSFLKLNQNSVINKNMIHSARIDSSNNKYAQLCLMDNGYRGNGKQFLGIVCNNYYAEFEPTEFKTLSTFVKNQTPVKNVEESLHKVMKQSLEDTMKKTDYQ